MGKGKGKGNSPKSAPAVTQVAATPTRPANVAASYIDAGSQQSYNTRYVDTPRGGVWTAGPQSDEWVRNYVAGSTLPTYSSQPSTSSEGSSGGGGGKPSLRSVGSNLSKGEAQRIADARNKPVGKIINKALNKGLTIGSALVNAYNRGDYTSSRDRFWGSTAQNVFGSKLANKMTGVSDGMAGLNGLKLSKGQVYGGTYMRDGQLTPLISVKGAGASTSGVGTNSTTNTTAPGGNTYSPQELMSTPTSSTYEMPEANNVNTSFSPGGSGAMLDGSATGFRKNRSSARKAGLTSKGTSQFRISGQTGRSSGLSIGI